MERRTETPLRVALVRQRYTPFGGAERFVDRVMETLVRQEITVTIVARRWRGDEKNESAPRCDPFHIGRLWRDYGFARCVQQQWLGRPEWVVQSHERIPGCNLYRAGDGVHAQWLHNRARIQNPWQYLATRFNPYHRYLCAMERRLFTHPSLRAVICNSIMVRDEIISWFQIPKEKLHVIYSGVDTVTFHPRSKEDHEHHVRSEWNIPPDATLFLFVGSGYERKGLLPLLQAMTQVKHAWLLVVGRDAQERKFKKIANRLQVSDRVRFAGGRKEVRPFYAAADAVVLPTLYDPFPNVALETMACGLPLVTSHQCGASDFLKEGRAGLLCDALDVATLAQHLTSLMDPQLRYRLGNEGRTLAETLTWERMGARLDALYRQVFNADLK
ncbi:MAG: glycosyltransferase family 4 protein [Magnetococcales bacterium]|nr:glycosyltransferase family 4 protein [Magnetococcales bacterium]MBF0151375.1 glycosyltransferase family 4 protein [Magnetococcales bacterium]MBF0174253.1 glycosyltransferase family 4 protein [Magnetococcales bacterium]MBF0348047.1 glycosyltransferase family 4 protein [Magnetococcales bacterium]MBF0632360.1 glycosyltransferase family 4 protein [Magnetococcales bacterium]